MITDLGRALRAPGPFGWSLVAVVVLAVLLAPAFLTPYLVSLLLSIAMYTAITASWNMVSGYCGYVSFGHVVFWGVGAYATAILITKAGLHWAIAMPLGGIASVALAAIFAYPILKLSGVYFAISTLALSEAVRVLVSYYRSLTGGGGGIYLPPLISLNTAYFLMVLIAASSLLFTHSMNFTKFGRSLIAIRENEVAAASLGISTTTRKVQVFLISAFFAGLAGSVYILNVAFIDPRTAFDITITLRAIMMAVFGGIGTALGPLIGSVGFQGFSELLWANFPFIHKALFGGLIVVIVLLMPQGLLPQLRSVLRQRAAREDSSGALAGDESV